MISQYTTFNFGLGETADMIREQVNAFARDEIALAPLKSMKKMSFPATYGASLAIWVCSV